jgi:CO/xanthine dehydrogenase Mo-binding subunit
MYRRDFLKQSGALIVAFSSANATVDLVCAAARSTGQGINGVPSRALDSWIAIDREGRVTACTGKCEIGQGLFTAQTQLIAEELRVPVERVTLIQCDTARTPDQGTTSGAQSHPANFNRANLALACATAREELLARAASRLGLPVTRLEVTNGVIVAADDASRFVAYADLVSARGFDVPLNAAAHRTPVSAWRVLGTPVKRLDGPALVSGRFEFVHNVRVDGMLHGRVVRPPEIGAHVVAVDESSIRDLAGIVRIVTKRNFIGVVADKPWQAMAAARQLRVQWSPGVAVPEQQHLYEYLRTHTPRRDSLSVDSGDVDQQLARAATRLTATYLYPYQMHGSIGTACAVADVRDGRATVWSATQAVYPLKNTLAMVLGIPPDNVRVVFRMGPGCYGVNGADTVSYDAALMSQAAGRPVRVQLSRQDEMAWENYGFAFVIDQRVGIAADGAIVAWDCETWSPTLGGRPGTANPGNVVTGTLAGFRPAAFNARTPAPPPQGSFSNGSNAVPSYVVGRVGAGSGGTGVVSSERVLSHEVESPFFTGPLRSPRRLQNTFAHESFMDEIAARVNADPVEYRLRHVRDPRLREVITAAARRAGWDTRSSPRQPRADADEVSGRGLACVLYEGDNGYCAMVAEVSVQRSTGRVRVVRCVVAMDAGPISNPDGITNQIEGGVVQGISRTLLEEVTWSGRQVTSHDWRRYRTLSLGDQAPVIDSVLIHRTQGDAMGAGETSITVTAAAIGNAIFDATGARLRQVPFTPERVRAAIALPGPVG